MGPTEPGSLGIGLGNEDGYVLGRGYASATRLNHQHYLWKNSQGFLLHPWIRKQIAKSEGAAEGNELAVAELATGTGVWLLDLQRSHELQGIKAHLDGYDISDGLFPRSKWLPPDVTFSTSNLLLDPPAELRGKYDLVHVRLVMAVGKEGKDAARRMIRHMQALLKPGGLLQWDELDVYGHHDMVTSGPVDVESTALHYLMEGLVKQSGDYRWVGRLPELLTEEGFEDVTKGVYEASPSDYHAWTCSDLLATEEMTWNLKEGPTGQAIRSKISQAYQEANDESIGAVVKGCPTVVVARKAM